MKKMEIDKSLKTSFKDEKVVGYGYLATNLVHLALTKKSEKKSRKLTNEYSLRRHKD